MASDDNVLFVRGNDNITATSDDVWDDTALIKAYDKAVNLAKEEVTKRLSQASQGKPIKLQKNDKSFNTETKPCRKWTIGAPCRAIYSEDGEVYEANIVKIFENSGFCIVKFVGYGNSEKVEMKSLLESNGMESRLAQEEDANGANKSQSELDTTESIYSSSSKRFGNQNSGEKMDWNQPEEAKSSKPLFNGYHEFHANIDQKPPAPPLPPQLMARLPENDTDALSSMLMSWYISGFHTGYYHGLKQARQSQETRKKC